MDFALTIIENPNYLLDDLNCFAGPEGVIVRDKANNLGVETPKGKEVCSHRMSAVEPVFTAQFSARG